MFIINKNLHQVKIGNTRTTRKKSQYFKNINTSTVDRRKKNNAKKKIKKLKPLFSPETF